MLGIMCCNNCTKRYVGCHSNCKDYILEKEKIEKIRQDRMRENDLYYIKRRKK